MTPITRWTRLSWGVYMSDMGQVGRTSYSDPDVRSDGWVEIIRPDVTKCKHDEYSWYSYKVPIIRFTKYYDYGKGKIKPYFRMDTKNGRRVFQRLSDHEFEKWLLVLKDGHRDLANTIRTLRLQRRGY